MIASGEPRKPLRVEKCAVEKKRHVSRTRMLVSFTFIILVTFFLYFAINNIESWVFVHSGDMISTNALYAAASAVVLGVYSFFILDFIKPVKFSIAISISAVIGSFMFLIFTIFLLL
jgi:hypothetical protein